MVQMTNAKNWLGCQRNDAIKLNLVFDRLFWKKIVYWIRNLLILVGCSQCVSSMESCASIWVRYTKSQQHDWLSETNQWLMCLMRSLRCVPIGLWSEKRTQTCTFKAHALTMCSFVKIVNLVTCLKRSFYSQRNRSIHICTKSKFRIERYVEIIDFHAFFPRLSPIETIFIISIW